MALFRPEVRAHQVRGTHGTILLLRPLSFTLLTCVAGGTALCFALYFYSGKYTNKARVSGMLIPEHGLLKIYPGLVGEIVEVNVREGQSVQQGQVLFVLSGERITARGKSLGGLNDQILLRRRSLEVELKESEQLGAQNLAALLQRIQSVATEVAAIDAEAALARQRAAIAEQALRRYEELGKAGFAAATQVQQKTEDHLALLSNLRSLERQRVVLERELVARRSEVRDLPLLSRSRTAQVSRALSSLEQEAGELEARREVRIVAPQAGTIAAMTSEQGQLTNPQIPLASIIPENDKLEAVLFAPSRSIGFVRTGQTVLLRYQAYPYQKFGTHRGTVTGVSQASLLAREVDGLHPPESDDKEPLFRIKVRLDAQEVTAYGIAQHLKSGMRVDADVHLDTRRLIEWVAEPLFSITGRWQ